MIAISKYIREVNSTKEKRYLRQRTMLVQEETDVRGP